MNADAVFFDSRTTIVQSENTRTLDFGRGKIVGQDRISTYEGSPPIADGGQDTVFDSAELGAEKNGSVSKATVVFSTERPWSNSLDRRLDDLLALYATKKASKEELIELVKLRAQKRSARPTRTGLELLEEIKRYEVTRNLTAAFEAYVKVVRPTR